MADSDNPEKMQKDLMDALKKMMAHAVPLKDPEPETVREEKDDETKTARGKKLRFDYKPRDVKKYLDRFVIKQEEAKRVLATAVCDHYNHVKRCEATKNCGYYFKQNVVMLGPTGIGKTHLVRHLAELIGVPFVKADATKFSETGYVGGDVEDLVRELVQKADGDLDLAQYGIVYLDEVDKIATALNLSGRDVSGSGVQRGLLKIMEETEVPLRNPQDMQSQFQSMLEFQKKGKITKPVINTRHILFIVSGSFDDLIPIIEKRQRQRNIGFGQTKREPELGKQEILSQVQTEDLIAFGFESEFVGRLPVRVVCHPLSEEDLYTILTTSEDSVLKQYVAAFSAYDIQMHIQEKALWEIAKLARKEGTGARGLFTTCERVFRDLKYELPSSQLRGFTLSAAMVHSPKIALQALLQEERVGRIQQIAEQVKNFERRFFQNHNIRIRFEPEAIKAIESKAISEDCDVEKLLDQMLSNYKYGLELIQKKAKKEEFLLSREVVENPNAVLDRWIKETYEHGPGE